MLFSFGRTQELYAAYFLLLPSALQLTCEPCDCKWFLRALLYVCVPCCEKFSYQSCVCVRLCSCATLVTTPPPTVKSMSYQSPSGASTTFKYRYASGQQCNQFDLVRYSGEQYFVKKGRWRAWRTLCSFHLANRTSLAVQEMVATKTTHPLCSSRRKPIVPVQGSRRKSPKLCSFARQTREKRQVMALVWMQWPKPLLVGLIKHAPTQVIPIICARTIVWNAFRKERQRLRHPLVAAQAQRHRTCLLFSLRRLLD